MHDARVSELRRAVQEYEDVLRNFPFRNIGEFSRGVDCNVKCAFCGDIGRHYSDSCPLVIENEYSYRIVKTHGPHCLGGCLPGRCKFPSRKCWHCEKLRGTRVEDLILNDGHHRALCPVPDVRIVLRERLNRTIEELDHVPEELDHLRSNE
ncbi:unnamed protein product [Heligmosomoides polygyrus]|uniref:CCHC-type domain-containing protein n=1 Tax=Heligmosomoides polygyrus TaxID=6339 RepID=A0A183G1V6_HELPZ|nr:unnamed protein product [Heligmosomoides polygyrus]